MDFNKRQLSLLRLPRELRGRIFEELIAGRVITIRPSNPKKSPSPWRRTEHWYAESIVPTFCSAVVALPCVCEQIYSEIAPLLFGANTIATPDHRPANYLFEIMPYGRVFSIKVLTVKATRSTRGKTVSRKHSKGHC
jgi:hypothetical protein